MQFAPKNDVIQAKLRDNSARIARGKAMIFGREKRKQLIISVIPTMLKMRLFPSK
jgi:hypothetical protein